MAHIYPSLMAIAQSNIEKTIKEFDPYCIGYHLDIMDGIFAPDNGLSIDTVNAIARMTKKQLWVHLMVTDLNQFLDKLQVPNGSMITFHFEAVGENFSFAKIIRENNWRPSIAINPKTNVEEIFPFLREVDQVTIMSVNPGFSGQPFEKDVLNKIEPLVGYRHTAQLKFNIGLDGGISLKNIDAVMHHRVDDLVVGSGIFSYPNPLEAFRLLEKKVSS